MQRKFLDSLVQQELDAIATDEANLVNKFATLCEHGRRFANLLSNKAAESCDRIRRLQEPLVRVMDRVLSLALPNGLKRGKDARDSVLKLREVVIDAEFDVEQLEARKRHSLKRSVSQAKLQVNLYPQGCVRTVRLEN